MTMNNTELNTGFTTKDEGYDDGSITVNDEPTIEDKTVKNIDASDFGYGNMDVDKETPPEDFPVPPTTPAVEGEEVPKEKSPTGYGDEDEEEEVTPPEESLSTEDEASAKEMEEVISKLPDTLDKDKIAQFAKDTGLTKEQLEAYGKIVKEEQEHFDKENAEALKNQKTNWTKELREDKEFGGENFDYNVRQAGKVLENNLPNMKKVLTEKGGMLPPYIMKDLHLLSKVLYPKTQLVNGDMPDNDKDKTHFLDILY